MSFCSKAKKQKQKAKTLVAVKGNYNIPTLGKVFQTWILPLPPHISNSCNLGLFLIIQASVWYLEKNVSNLSSINNDMRSLENYPVSCFVHFGHLMQRTDSLGEILMLEKIEGRRGWQDEIVGWHHWVDGHEFEWTPGVGDGQGDLETVIHEVTKSWKWLSDWTELNWIEL